jgi:2-C-methyl-D-erythritol 4-phosphate cytidylyltransferase
VVSAIIVAAGESTRMGTNKLFLKVGEIPAVVRSLLAFESAPSVEETVVVTKPEYREQYRLWQREYSLQKLRAVTVGGTTRQQSVLAGIMAASKASEYFAIHDGARPFIDPHDIERVIRDARRYGAATLGVPVKDTIKVVTEDGFIERTPDRNRLFSTQTPQVFLRAVYLEGVESARRDGLEFTDDCQLVEYAGYRVYMTKGDYKNIKLTTKDDLLVAGAFAKGE